MDVGIALREKFGLDLARWLSDLFAIVIVVARTSPPRWTAAKTGALSVARPNFALRGPLCMPL